MVNKRTVVKLEIGKEYTYNRLCELLNEDKVNGGNRTTQINKWKRYFHFEHKPQSRLYKVINIYDKPQPKEKDKKPYGNHSKYTDNCAQLLLEVFGEKNRSKDFSFYNLVTMFGLQKDIFIPRTNERDRDYYIASIHNTKEREVIKNVLETLHRNNDILYCKGYVIEIKGSLKRETANKRVVCAINTAIDEVLEGMDDLKNISDVYRKHLDSDFRREVLKILNRDYDDIKDYHTIYSITVRDKLWKAKRVKTNYKLIRKKNNELMMLYLSDKLKDEMPKHKYIRYTQYDKGQESEVQWKEKQCEYIKTSVSLDDEVYNKIFIY